MNYFLGIFLFMTANFMLVASFQNRSVFNVSSVLEKVPNLPVTNLTLPGTKWCKIGSSSSDSDYNDLGKFNKSDECCRAHQQCEEVIEPIGTLHSLNNLSILPKYHCKCEQELFTCLKNLNTIPSVVIGTSYFGVMQQCFAEDYPAVECIEYQKNLLGKRCIIYKFDESKEKKWQFFDMPYYTKQEE